MYKALKSFSGLVNMTKNEIKEINDVTIANDLLRAGYIEKVKEVSKEEIKEIKKETKEIVKEIKKEEKEEKKEEKKTKKVNRKTKK